MGSAFRLPIWTGPSYDEVMQWCRQGGISAVCAAADSGMSFTDIDWTSARALVMGPESIGLSAEEIESAGASVRIPMEGSVESLNVSVAAGIILFEAARQRRSDKL
jgi:TrmH family RNA methyltransferase